MADPPAEIRHLLGIETDDRAELLFRYGAILAGSVLAFAYTGWAAALGWGVGFLAVHRVLVGFLRARSLTATPRDLVVAAALFTIVLAVFVSLPTWLVLRDDPALRVSGAAVIGAMLVFMVRRGDRLVGFVACQVLVIGTSVALIGGHTIAQTASPVGRLGVAAAGLALVFYLGQALLIGRGRILAAERAAELAIQEQKMAAIGRLAGGVAHDFNNILTAIMGNLELSEHLSGAERDAALGDARSEARRAATLVRQLLVYARKSRTEATVEDAGAVLREAARLARRVIPASIATSLTVDAKPLWVEVDLDLLMTALMNLISNAGDAMPKGGTLCFEARRLVAAGPTAVADGRLLPAGSYAALSVADTGAGIPAAILPKVVEPFFTTKPVGQGTGLGLPMVTGFAAGAEGGLLLASGPEGTRATILLPLRDG